MCWINTMVIMRLKHINLFNSTILFRSVSNISIFKSFHQNEDCRISKNYSKAENVEKTTTNENETDFSDKLIKWAIQNNISHISFSKLLKILSEYGIEELPQNSRALLKAKEDQIKVSTVAPGIYTHFGLEKNLKSLILSLISKNLYNKTVISVSIFIDNLPLTKYSQGGLWVILGSIESFTNNIFLVGAYQGYSRPNDSNLFLSEFVTEAKHLCTKGLEINGDVYSVKIKRLICDAPAKAFVLNITDFNGYSSCTKCNTVGQYRGKKICFPEKGTPKKDADFEKSEMYQTCKTNLLEIPNFGVVSNVTLDYMHLVCLGVVQKLLSLWLTDKYWVSEKSASEMIKILAPSYPCEFQKKPKSFRIFSRWSGLEFRQFLLYHGPVVLRNNLNKEHFDHFLLLHVACRLLCIDPSPENIDTSRTLLSSFVENYKKLYKSEQITHNFHGLYHLADECASHGTLDSFSAFPFENFLLRLRNLMRKYKKRAFPNTILKQSYDNALTKSLAKLTTDEYKVGKKLKVTDDSQFAGYSHMEKLSFKNFEIVPGTREDNCVLLKNGNIIEVTSVLEKKEKSSKTHLIAGKEFSSVSSFHSKPYDCLQLNMYTVGEVSDTVVLWPIDTIDKKCMRIPIGSKETVMIGLLDENF